MLQYPHAGQGSPNKNTKSGNNSFVGKPYKDPDLEKAFVYTLMLLTTFYFLNVILIVQNNTSAITTFLSNGGEAISLRHVKVGDALDMKYGLLRDGLELDQDFMWEYHRSSWDDMTGVNPSQVTFAFRDPALATYYRLKWV
jgi:hypothetical protein